MPVLIREAQYNCHTLHLQQTRIDQGTSYWHRLMERFPSVEELAAADEDEVLLQWQGLGYYSRARNLHHAARQIVEMGQFPSSFKALQSLKGVGRYTEIGRAHV